MRIELPERVQLADIETFTSQVSQAEGPVEIDARQVRQVDAATLQWLLSLHRSERLQWAGLSDAFTATVARLSLADRLGLAPAPAPEPA